MAINAQLIAGQWQQGSGATLTKLAPEDHSVLWQAASAGAAEVQAACAAARGAFYAWSTDRWRSASPAFSDLRPCWKRKKRRWRRLSPGKPASRCGKPGPEVQAMIGKAGISIEAYSERTGQRETAMPDGKALLRHKPHGVMAVFGPYNFPGHLPNGHIIPALIAGNTVVFKPSELTPATAELTVQLWLQAGIPDGVINLIQGGKRPARRCWKTGISTACCLPAALLPGSISIATSAASRRKCWRWRWAATTR